jgi:hypothetical protein
MNRTALIVVGCFLGVSVAAQEAKLPPAAPIKAGVPGSILVDYYRGIAGGAVSDLAQNPASRSIRLKANCSSRLKSLPMKRSSTAASRAGSLRLLRPATIYSGSPRMMRGSCISAPMRRPAAAERSAPAPVLWMPESGTGFQSRRASRLRWLPISDITLRPGTKKPARPAICQSAGNCLPAPKKCRSPVRGSRLRAWPKPRRL